MRIIRIVQHACARFADQISAGEAEELANERKRAATALGEPVAKTLDSLDFANEADFQRAWHGFDSPSDQLLEHAFLLDFSDFEEEEEELSLIHI